MDRSELTLALAGALIGAFLFGWSLRWLFGRIDGAGPKSVARTARMAAQLHAAEDALHRAEQRLADQEAECARRVFELEAEVDSMRRALASAEGQAEEIRAAYRKSLIGREP